MKLEDELFIARMAEAEASGILTPAERLELDLRLAEPAFAQAYKEYYHTIASLLDGGKRARFKATLQDVHAELEAKKPGMRRLIIHFNPRHLRTAAIAAGVALLTSAVTVFTLRHSEPKLVTTQNLERVRHEVARIKATQQKQEKDINDLKENTEAATAPATPQSNYSGTGFALSNDGYLITNYHVVEGAENLQIVTRDGKSHMAGVVAYEPKNDIALLKIDDKNFRFAKGELPYSFLTGKASLGASIYTLGFPQDEIVYNEGYISSRNGNEGDSNQYRLEVPAGPGQSGAPVVDATGNIIGVIRSKDAQTENTTYAVSSKTLLRLLHDVPKDKRPRLPLANRMSGLSRQQQIEKLQDYTCMVQVYKK